MTERLPSTGFLSGVTSRAGLSFFVIAFDPTPSIEKAKKKKESLLLGLSCNAGRALIGMYHISRVLVDAFKFVGTHSDTNEAALRYAARDLMHVG